MPNTVRPCSHVHAEARRQAHRSLTRFSCIGEHFQSVLRSRRQKRAEGRTNLEQGSVPPQRLSSCNGEAQNSVSDVTCHHAGGKASGQRTVVQMEQVVALDERVNRVTLAVSVRQLTDDARVLLVEVVRQPAQLKGLDVRSSEKRERRLSKRARGRKAHHPERLFVACMSSPMSANATGSRKKAFANGAP